MRKYLTGREGRDFEFPSLEIRLDSGEGVTAIVPIYAGKNLISDVSADQLAAMILRASGKSGRCVDYVRKIAAQLDALGIRDEAVTLIRAALDRVSPLAP